MRNLLFGLALAVLTACGSDSTGPASVSVVGTFQLKTINGAALPYVAVQAGTTKLEVTAEQITINADGTYSELSSVRSTSGGSVTTSQSGSIGVYTATNGQMSFTQTTPATGLTFSGSVSNATLTIIYPSGLSFVYQR